MDNERYLVPSKNNKGGKKGTEQRLDEVKTMGIKKTFVCPYKECGKQFTESGNLKTHIRIHVCKVCDNDRLEKDHLRVDIQTAERALLPRDT